MSLEFQFSACVTGHCPAGGEADDYHELHPAPGPSHSHGVGPGHARRPHPAVCRLSQESQGTKPDQLLMGNDLLYNQHWIE